VGFGDRRILAARRYAGRVTDDDDDWVGTPPEGRYTRDRAKPEFWRNQWPPAGIGLLVVAIAVVVILLTR
jgi:hypothetical protein